MPDHARQPVVSPGVAGGDHGAPRPGPGDGPRPDRRGRRDRHQGLHVHGRAGRARTSTRPAAAERAAPGRHGPLRRAVVRPAVAAQAYGTTRSTAFDDEAVLVLSEIDPALNTRANPAAFDMRKFAPAVLPRSTARRTPTPIRSRPSPAAAVLLRYVNAGIQYHSMGVLGARPDGDRARRQPAGQRRGRYVAETFGPGQTADAIVTAPAATADARLAVYDASLLLHNSNTAGFGGMLTFDRRGRLRPAAHPTRRGRRRPTSPTRPAP